MAYKTGDQLWNITIFSLVLRLAALIAAAVQTARTEKSERFA
jgi:hypothetical protein